MALCRLQDNGNTVNFNPLITNTQQRPDIYIREINTVQSGNILMHEYGNARQWEIDITEVSYASYSLISAWWAAMTSLTFYPDYDNDPGTTYTVRIINDESPLNMLFPYWRQYYEGTLIIRETT